MVASCGAPLTAATVLRFAEVFGEILYNVYGSTEVSWATIPPATPTPQRCKPRNQPPPSSRIRRKAFAHNHVRVGLRVAERAQFTTSPTPGHSPAFRHPESTPN
ncbi:hypothetical protein [Nocardia macrotermitis]|uniref:hypothetical protein n=1 Tax=Nocardia macrotermitis TaxID=2585198 RepID=UPI003872ACDB